MATVPIEHNNLIFSSVENAYMYVKCPHCIVENEGKDISWEQFCLTMPPNIVKKKSKDLPVHTYWGDIKLKVMYTFLLKKFSQEPFKSKLLATGNENIIEGNYWNDTFWGVDLKQNPNIGENWLGRLIMDIRLKLRKMT